VRTESKKRKKEKREDKGRPEVRTLALLSARHQLDQSPRCEKGVLPHLQHSSLCNPPTQIM